ncbi:E3 ubiquitin-protein ligase RFWD3 isoform X1 [Durio zibethinus]|uniref:RING-type E3 ubiquitin transferase n=1 Tax=Durio zibethinus TaxID=66656 RepID=A0A6P6AR16_DURZI|nr:E3 ubiquitin-protein ligase RFWD3 isoform X1 [Durio zibethinus]
MSNPNPNPNIYIVVDQESEEDSEETEESEEDSEEEEQEESIPVMESPRVSGKDGEKGVEGRICSSLGESGENSQGKEWNRGDIDGLFCPICLEAWTTIGDHHVCCLPCGHIFGFSCICKWLQQRGTTRKCPQCNRKCTLKDVRKLFASWVVAIDGESQQIIRSLKAKCISLEKKSADLSNKDAEWRKREVEWKKREAVLQQELHQLKEKTNFLEQLLDVQSGKSGRAPSMGGYQVQSLGHSPGSEFNGQGPFILQKELKVDGARLFDVDASSEILLMTRRLQGLGGTHVLTKMSLVVPYERQDISLPYGTKAVRDLRICPFGRSLALFASLGKKLSVLSTESNNVILAYDLPAAAWSCSWDLNNSHQIYAGLQNGSLLVFDLRQTARPMESVNGLTSNPVHTIHSLHNSIAPSRVTAILSASSVGICQWSFGGSEERPFLLSETGYQGVCISLSYCPISDNIIASYRPRIDFPNEMASSQPLLTPLIGRGVQGSHVHLKRAGSNSYQKLGVTCANVNDIRLPRSTIMNIENHGCLFASGDELTGELVLQELPSFTVVQRLKLPKHPIHDVKYAQAFNGGLLGCLSEDILQLFRNRDLK